MKKEISAIAFVTLLPQSTRFNPGPLFEYSGLRGPCRFADFFTYFVLWIFLKNKKLFQSLEFQRPIRGYVQGLEFSGILLLQALSCLLIVFLSCQINEMSKEVTKLKEALNSLSQLSYSASSSKRQSQQLEALQQQVKQLQNQLAVSGAGAGRPGRFQAPAQCRGQGAGVRRIPDSGSGALQSN